MRKNVMKRGKEEKGLQLPSWFNNKLLFESREYGFDYEKERDKHLARMVENPQYARIMWLAEEILADEDNPTRRELLMNEAIVFLEMARKHPAKLAEISDKTITKTLKKMLNVD